MTRIAVILSTLVFAAACDVGSVVSNNQGGPDGSVGGGGDTGGGSNGSGSGSGSNCIPLSNNLPTAHHNAGMTCLQGGCHLTGNTGANAPAYAVAGTLYRDPQGTNAYAGATITVTVGGTKHTAVTASDGNFYITSALMQQPPTNAMTGTTNASACPSTNAMSGLLVDNGGNCNNCHRTGGTTLPLYVLP